MKSTQERAINYIKTSPRSEGALAFATSVGINANAVIREMAEEEEEEDAERTISLENEE